MRILWLLTLLPYPPDTGGKQDSFFMLREFADAGDEITCGVVYQGAEPPDVPEGFARLVKEVVFLPGNPKALHSRLLGSLGDDVPFKFRKYHSREASDILASLLEKENGFDFLLIDHLHLAPLMLEVREHLRKKGVSVPPLVLRSPNVESTIVTKYAERVENPLVKAFAQRESRKVKAYEAGVLAEFDLVAAISPVDKATFEGISDRPANIISVTAGVEVDKLRPSDEPPVDGEVVFVGTFDWQPNVDGALWLANEVWPKVAEAYPKAHLSLVGRKPPPLIENLAGDSIAVTGEVESVEEYVARAGCCVVPLWIGSGMRLKILEAFALGRAVVSTSLGAEGIEIEDGGNILIRDEPESFAKAVIDVLTKPELRDRLGTNARALVERRYSWKRVAGGFRNEILKLLGK